MFMIINKRPDGLQTLVVGSIRIHTEAAIRSYEHQSALA